MKKTIFTNLILFVFFNVLQINNVFPWDNEVTQAGALGSGLRN